MTKLYRHQQALLNKNPNKSLVCWQTGTGKSLAAIEWAKLRGGTCLVVVPKALKEKWARDVKKYHGQDMTWDIMSKEEFRSMWDKLVKPTSTIVDECFPAGTKILVNSGYKNIEDIKVGDEIISALGSDVVYAINSRKTNQLVVIKLSNGEIIKTTSNHPFFTSKGWVIAGNLRKSSVLLHYSTVRGIINSNETLQTVWRNKPSWLSRERENFLQEILSTEVFMGDKKRRNDPKVDNSPSDASSTCHQFFNKNDQKKPDEETSCAKKDDIYAKENWTSSDNSRRQRETASVATKNLIGSAWRIMASRICRKNWVWTVATSFQNRYRAFSKKNSDRSGWQFSFHDFEKKTGSAQGKDFKEIRVESVEIQERAGTVVYNLSVKNHPSYIVSDVLVHNCHYFSGINSLMSKSLYKFIKKHSLENILLLTATPYLSTPWNIYTLARHLGYNWNYMEFKQAFFQDRYIGRRVVPEVKKGIEPAIAKLVAGIGDVVRLDECADVPDQVFESEMFKMTPAQEAAKKEIVEVNPIVRFTKHHQIEQGTLKDDGYTGDKFFENDKLVRIMEYCAGNPKIAIVCRYNLQIDAIYKALGETELGQHTYVIRGDVKNRDAVVQAVEKAERAIVLINAECSEGYELPSVNLWLFASLSFSYKAYVQMCGRALRINNLKKNVYIHLVTAGGVDQEVFNSILAKQDFSLAIYSQKYEN